MMEKVIEQLNEQKEFIEVEISERERFYNFKSGDWRISEKGRDYVCKTNELEYISDEIEELINHIKIYMQLKP